MGIAFSLDTSNNRCVLINLSLEQFIRFSLFNLNIELAFQDLKYFVLHIVLNFLTYAFIVVFGVSKFF